MRWLYDSQEPLITDKETFCSAFKADSSLDPVFISEELRKEIPEILKEIDEEYARDLKSSETLMQDTYNTLVSTLEEKSKKEELMPKQIMDLIIGSPLSENEENFLILSEDEETETTKLTISIPNPEIEIKSKVIELDGTDLRRLIDVANNNSLSEANRQLEEFSQSGIGEISVINDWKTHNRFRYSAENVIGVIGDEDNSPYLTGGKKTSDAGLTDLQVKCPYDYISDMMCMQSKLAEMTPKQIEKFNHRLEPVEIKKHSYRYGRVDGYYSRTVYDFEINGEEYHIKDSDWANGGKYTVVWKGKEENYPEIAMGISGSYSEYASGQCGVNINSVIGFINQNPNRFSKLFDKIAEKDDCRGLFPTPHIEELCSDIMKMKTESELKREKEQNMQYPDNEFLEEMVDSATTKKELTEREKGVKDLLVEYEEKDSRSKSFSDDE